MRTGACALVPRQAGALPIRPSGPASASVRFGQVRYGSSWFVDGVDGGDGVGVAGWLADGASGFIRD